MWGSHTSVMSHPIPGLYDVSRELVVGNLSETHVSPYEMTPAACMDLQKKNLQLQSSPVIPPRNSTHNMPGEADGMPWQINGHLLCETLAFHIWWPRCTHILPRGVWNHKYIHINFGASTNRNQKKKKGGCYYHAGGGIVVFSKVSLAANQNSVFF